MKVCLQFVHETHLNIYVFDMFGNMSISTCVSCQTECIASGFLHLGLLMFVVSVGRCVGISFGMFLLQGFQIDSVMLAQIVTNCANVGQVLWRFRPPVRCTIVFVFGLRLGSSCSFPATPV